jgi:hypothetical protein
MLFDGDLLLDMEMTIYEDLMVKCGGFSVTLSGSHFQFRTPFTSVFWSTTTTHTTPATKSTSQSTNNLILSYLYTVVLSIIYPSQSHTAVFYDVG